MRPALPVLDLVVLPATLVLCHPAHAGCSYNGKSYPDAHSACAALLATQKPPETVKLAKLNPETGDVKCVGQPRDSSITPFDMWATLCEAGTPHANAEPAAGPAVGKPPETSARKAPACPTGTSVNASLEVENRKTTPRVTPQVTLVSIPDSMQGGTDGALPSRWNNPWCQ